MGYNYNLQMRRYKFEIPRCKVCLSYLLGLLFAVFYFFSAHKVEKKMMMGDVDYDDQVKKILK